MAAATGIFRSCDLWWALSSCSRLFEQTRPLNGSRLRPSPTAREVMLCLVELVDCDTTGLQQISRSRVLQPGRALYDWKSFKFSAATILVLVLLASHATANA